MADITITETRLLKTTIGPSRDINLSLKPKAQPDHYQEIRVVYKEDRANAVEATMDLTAADAEALVEGLQHFIDQIVAVETRITNAVNTD